MTVEVVAKKVLRSRGWGRKKRRELANTIPEATAEDNEALAIAARYSMVNKFRLWALLQAVQHVARENVAGDFVECGVWKGGNLILYGLMARRYGLTRRIWGYDTFEGMTEPTDNDVQFGTNVKAHTEWASRQSGDVNTWCYSPFEEVEHNFRGEVGDAPLTLVKGKVEDTLDRPENIPERIAILRLDTDWYESTRKELEVLYPRLERGGVLLIDDYGAWSGSRKAVDEYFADKPVWLHRVDHSARLHIKR
jgi:hypothetical protein